MSLATGIIANVNAALNRVNVCDRVVSMRVRQSSGGDPLLGLAVNNLTTDTILDPVPAIQAAAKNYPLMVEGTAMTPDCEYLMTVSATAMSRAQVLDPTVTIIFTDNLGVVEELFIAGYTALFIQGVDVCFNIILSSKVRGGS